MLTDHRARRSHLLNNIYYPLSVEKFAPTTPCGGINKHILFDRADLPFTLLVGAMSLVFHPPTGRSELLGGRVFPLGSFCLMSRHETFADWGKNNLSVIQHQIYSTTQFLFGSPCFPVGRLSITTPVNLCYSLVRTTCVYMRLFYR